jgi:hypothetical protein
MAQKYSDSRSSSAVFSLSTLHMNGSHMVVGRRLAGSELSLCNDKECKPCIAPSGRRNRSVRSHRRQWALRGGIIPTNPLSHFDFVTYAQDSARRAGTSVLTEDRLI